MIDGNIFSIQCISASVSEGMEVGRDVGTIGHPLKGKDLSTSTCHSEQTAHTILSCS